MIDWFFENKDFVMALLGPVMLIHGAAFLLHKDYLLKWTEQNLNTVGSLWRRGMRGVFIGTLFLVVVRADPSSETYLNFMVGGSGFLLIALGIWILVRLPQLVGRPVQNVNPKNAGTFAMGYMVSGFVITYTEWLDPIIFG